MTDQPLLPEAAAATDDLVRAALQRYGLKLTEARRALLRRVVDARTRQFTMVLEDLKDPHNISAVIRTSEVFGLQDVHVINEVNPYRVTKSVLKGSYKWLDIHCHARRKGCYEMLKQRGYRIAVASTNHSSSLFRSDGQPSRNARAGRRAFHHPPARAHRKHERLGVRRRDLGDAGAIFTREWAG